jgi:riboflavin biosynthesis pyrimidine reductase
MVMTADGSHTGPDGLSGSISSSTDRAVMKQIRRYADAYLVGAGTVRAEGYGAVRADPEAAEHRARLGLAPAATLAIVSGSCRFDWDNTDFRDSDNRPIILTVDSSAPEDRAAAARWCDVEVVGEQRVQARDALAALADRGLTRVTCEGGDALLSEVIRAGVLDELDITIAPLLTAASRPARTGDSVLHPLRLAHLMADAGFLFARYLAR